MSELSVEGTITFFKILFTSKTVQLGLTTSVAAFIIEQPNI